jgi:hypothetical protein
MASHERLEIVGSVDGIPPVVGCFSSGAKSQALLSRLFRSSAAQYLCTLQKLPKNSISRRFGSLMKNLACGASHLIIHYWSEMTLESDFNFDVFHQIIRL